MKRSHSQEVDMERPCSHGKGVGFIQKENWKGKRGKNELKKDKGMYAIQEDRHV